MKIYLLSLLLCVAIVCQGQLPTKVTKDSLYEALVHDYISLYASLATDYDTDEKSFRLKMGSLFLPKATIYNDVRQHPWDKEYFTELDSYIKYLFSKTNSDSLSVSTIDPQQDSIMYGQRGGEYYVWIKKGIVINSGNQSTTLISVCRLRVVVYGKYNAQKLQIKEVRLEKGLPFDNDGDQVPDIMDDKQLDICPDRGGAAVTFVNGCPDDDKDGDGIPEVGIKNYDLCPDVAGSKKARGCPDKDGDGVPDYLDACPNDKGRPKDGCPLPPADRFSSNILVNFAFQLGADLSRKTIYNTLANKLRSDAGFASGYYIDIDVGLRYNMNRWMGVNAGLFTRKLLFGKEELIKQTASYLNANGVKVDSTTSSSNDYYFFGNVYAALAFGNFRSSRLFFRIEPTLVYTFASNSNRFNMKLNYASYPAQDIYINLNPKSFLMYGLRVSCEGNIFKGFSPIRWMLASRFLTGQLPFGRDMINFPNNLGPLKFNDMRLRTLDFSAGLAFVFVKFKDLYPQSPKQIKTF
jgi:hypothetical protein